MSILHLFGLDRKSREQRSKVMVILELKRDWVRNAKWNYQEAKNFHHRGEQDLAMYRLGQCISFVMMAHIDDPAGIYSGYSLDLTLPTMIAKVENAKHNVLEPKLLEILNCDDESKKSQLVLGLTWIMMCIMDPSGCPIKSRMFFEIFEAQEIPNVSDFHKDEYLKNLLEPLGFKPHVGKEGDRKFTIWYFPMLR